MNFRTVAAGSTTKNSELFPTAAWRRPQKVREKTSMGMVKGKVKGEPAETANPSPFCGKGFPLGVGGALLSHGLPQYHRRGGA